MKYTVLVVNHGGYYSQGRDVLVQSKFNGMVAGILRKFCEGRLNRLGPHLYLEVMEELDVLRWSDNVDAWGYSHSDVI